MTAWQERARERTESVLSNEYRTEIDESSRAWIDRMYSGSDSNAAAEARDQVEGILQSEGFVDANRNWFSELIEAYFEWRDDKLGAQEAPPMSTGSSSSWSPDEMLFAIIIAVIVVLILVLVTRHFRGRRHDVERRGTVAERIASRVESLRARARDAEAAGDWVEALRLDFFALVIGLGERGDLDYRDAWTNRELLERGMPSRKVELSLRPVVKRLDAHSFGHLPSGRDEVVEFREFCDRLLEGRA